MVRYWARSFWYWLTLLLGVIATGVIGVYGMFIDNGLGAISREELPAVGI